MNQQQLFANWFGHTWIYITIWVQQTNCGDQHGEDTTKVPYRIGLLCCVKHIVQLFKTQATFLIMHSFTF
jgi:hypothetical protein